MRKIFIFYSVFLLGCILPAGIQAESGPNTSGKLPQIAKYGDLLERVEQGDSAVSFLELRLAYSRTGEYKPYRDDLKKLQDQMFQNLDAGHFQQAIDAATHILDKQYIDINAHMACAVAYDSLKDSAHAAFHHNIVNRLLASIAITGNGHSPDSSCLIILIPEEYAFVRSFGWKVNTQSLKVEGDRCYDVLEVTDPKTSKASVLYFDVSIPWSKLKSKF